MEIPLVNEPFDISFNITKFIYTNKKVINKIKRDKIINKISRQYNYVVGKLIVTKGTLEQKKWVLKERVLNKKDINRRIKIGADLWGDLRHNRPYVPRSMV